jgi:hypothetical protein
MGINGSYRTHADECRRLAAEARDQYHRHNWTLLAECWARFADAQDKRAEARFDRHMFRNSRSNGRP